MSEAKYYVHLAHKLGYLEGADLESLTALQAEASKTLYGLIRWLERQTAAGKVTQRDLAGKAGSKSRE